MALLVFNYLCGTLGCIYMYLFIYLYNGILRAALWIKYQSCWAKGYDYNYPQIGDGTKLNMPLQTNIYC